MSVKAIRVLVVVTFLLIAGIAISAHLPNTSKPTAQAAVQQTPSTIPTPETLLAAINNERIKVGSPVLTLDPLMNQGAQEKCNDMVADKYFEHVDPVTKKQGYTYSSDLANLAGNYGENLTQPTPFTVEQALYNWDHSKLHHDALLDSRYTKTGFGICGTDIVEHFYSPQNF